MNIGDAFLISTPPKGKHLYVVIAQNPQGGYLCVNATSKKGNSETTCELAPGDHPFITHTSVIAYKHAREFTATDIDRLGIPKSKCSNDLLKRIQDGGLTSKRLKNKYKKTLKTFLEIPDQSSPHHHP